MHFEDDVLVFVVDRRVRHHGADELADLPLWIGVDVADPERGIGVFVGRLKRHGVADLLGFSWSLRR